MERKYDTPELIKIMRIYRGRKVSLPDLKTLTWSMVLEEDRFVKRGRRDAIDCRGSSNWLLLLGSEVFFVGVKKKNLAQRLLLLLENGNLEEFADGDLEEQTVDEGHLLDEAGPSKVYDEPFEDITDMAALGHEEEPGEPGDDHGKDVDEGRGKGGKRNPLQWLEDLVSKPKAILLCAAQEVEVTCAMVSKEYLTDVKVGLTIPEVDGLFPGAGLEFISGETLMLQVDSGMTISPQNIRVLPLGDGWIMPIKIFFKINGVVWQDTGNKKNHLIIRGPKHVDQGVLDGKPSLWGSRHTPKEDYWRKKF